jgi:hypothetical protein
VELNSLPVGSSSAGFVYRFRSDLALYERASNEFGPFFTERALRNGRGQAALGISFQTSRFGSLQGGDLRDGTFPTNAARFTNAIDPFSVDTLTLNLVTRSATPFFTYGLTNRLDVGVVVPIVNIEFSGTRSRLFEGQTTLQSAQSGSATGLGDMTVTGRYLLAGSGTRGLAVGGDLRLPTGNKLDLLGSDEVAGRMLAIASWEEEQLAVHVNAGVGLGGITREYFWSTGTTYAASQRVTIIAETMGRYLTELSRLSDIYQPHPVVEGVETMRWLPSRHGLHTMFIVTGAKWNLTRSWMLNTSVLMRMTDVGLRARFTPAISLDHAFEH